MSSSFERHGLDHLSASSCSLFAAQPALWVMERLLKRKAPVGAAAHRGTAAEAGVAYGLLDPAADIGECVAVANETYRTLTALSGDPKREQEGETVGPIVRMALPELRSYGQNVRCQDRIEWRAEGVSVPFIGFIDFYWPYHKILTDLKTTGRLPGEIRTSHARQVSSYAGQMGNCDARVTYATKAKVATYKIENVVQHTAALVRIARTIERFLAKSDDSMELAMLLVPDVDSFYFADPVTRQLAWELWQI